MALVESQHFADELCLCICDVKSDDTDMMSIGNLQMKVDHVNGLNKPFPVEILFVAMADTCFIAVLEM